MKKMLFTMAVCLFTAQAAHAESLCTAQEAVIFSGTTGSKLVSVCAPQKKDGTVGDFIYRFGTAQNIEIALPAKGKTAAETFSTGVLSYAGGGGQYLRVANGSTQYVVYSGIGKGWEQAGLTVFVQGKRKAELLCQQSTLLQDVAFSVEGQRLGYRAEEGGSYEIDVKAAPKEYDWLSFTIGMPEKQARTFPLRKQSDGSWVCPVALDGYPFKAMPTFENGRVASVYLGGTNSNHTVFAFMDKMNSMGYSLILGNGESLLQGEHEGTQTMLAMLEKGEDMVQLFFVPQKVRLAMQAAQKAGKTPFDKELMRSFGTAITYLFTINQHNDIMAINIADLKGQTQLLEEAFTQ